MNIETPQADMSVADMEPDQNDFASEDFSDLTDPPRSEPSMTQPVPYSDEPASLSAVLDVPVRVQAILGRTRISVDNLVRLAPGNVVELDRKVGEPVDIFVNDRLIARGEVVMVESALGVTLTEIVREEH